MKKVLVLGSDERMDEFNELDLQNAEVEFSDAYILSDSIEMVEEDGMMVAELDLPFDFRDFEVVFDLNLDENPDNVEVYAQYPHLQVVGCAVKNSLAQMIGPFIDELNTPIFGLNCLPTFLHRSVLECSLLRDTDKPDFEALMKELGLDFQLVDDRTGMVTPRIICMIINEACFVLQQGTADVAAVDQAMKLGTNYPHGPFEWADKIGIANVFEVIHAIQLDSGEEKYKVAANLKRMALLGDVFYPELV